MYRGVIQTSRETEGKERPATSGARCGLFFGRLVSLSLAGVSLSLSACSSANVATVDPLESRLMALENRSMRLRASEVQEQQEMLRQARMSWPEPDFSKTPDVIVADAPVASRKGNPIGRITAN